MLIAEYDYATDIAVQREEAFSQGEHKMALHTARILKQLGDTVQKIAKATGLSKEEIEKL